MGGLPISTPTARWLPALLLALALLLLSTGLARAHGGGFAPPPPPEAKGAPGGGVAPPSHVDPGFGGPIVTPGSSGGVSPGRASRRKTPITVTLETSWQLWWTLHRDAFLAPALRRSAQVMTEAAGGPPSPTPAHVSHPAAYHSALESQALPLLRRLVDPATEAPADVVASACLALGKLAHEDTDADALLTRLEASGAPDLVRESAALALGLLRRSAAEARVGTRHLEIVRSRLLRVFDRFVGGVRAPVPTRTRAFAMYAIALLGDQPFQDDPLSRDGRVLSKLLWERLGVPYEDRELHIALLTALGRQPSEGIADGVQSALREVVRGKRVHGHRWDVLKRAHAVTAIARLGGVRGESFLLRVTADPRLPLTVRLAAELAMVERAPSVAAAGRSAAVRVLSRGFVLEQQLLAVGLANVALGRMVGADLAAGSTRLLEIDETHRLLLQRAEKAPWWLRGHALLALGLAVAPVAKQHAPVARAFRARAVELLMRVLRDSRAQASARGAAAVALGLAGALESAPGLLEVARSPREEAEVRGHAALALGQLGPAAMGVVEALSDLVVDSGEPVVSEHAALALSLRGEGAVTDALLERLRTETATRRLAAAARALGRLGDLAAVGPLVALAERKGARPLARAMAVVALGRLLDPEPRPSLLRITFGACYPARTPDMQEVFTIL